MTLTIRDIEAANRAAGRHFFEAATMRFFDSKVAPKVYADRFFLTSEQFHPGYPEPPAPRRWTIRQFDAATGEVETAEGTEFQQFESKQDAVEFLAHLGVTA